jgi:hypothetical protein
MAEAGWCAFNYLASSPLTTTRGRDLLLAEGCWRHLRAGSEDLGLLKGRKCVEIGCWGGHLIEDDECMSIRKLRGLYQL